MTVKQKRAKISNIIKVILQFHFIICIEFIRIFLETQHTWLQSRYRDSPAIRLVQIFYSARPQPLLIKAGRRRLASDSSSPPLALLALFLTAVGLYHMRLSYFPGVSLCVAHFFTFFSCSEKRRMINCHRKLLEAAACAFTGCSGPPHHPAVMFIQLIETHNQCIKCTLQHQCWIMVLRGLHLPLPIMPDSLSYFR